MSEGPPILLCAAVADMVGPPEVYPEGSQVRWCHICACEVFVSPSGQEMMAQEGALPVCAECMIGLPEGPLEVAPATRRDLHEHGSDDAEIAETIAIANADLARRRARRRAAAPDQPGSRS